MHARTGAHVDEMVGLQHRVAVVLDHQHGVAEVAQALERLEQALIVALMQSDRRLVENVQHADQARADLRGQPDALAFAAREARRDAIQRQVVQPDVGQEAEPLADLLEDQPRDLLLLAAQLGRGEERHRLLDRHRGDLGDRFAVEADVRGFLS